MKFLITGGAGFIGSHLVDALLARGDQVAVVDDFNDYYDPLIKRSNIAGKQVEIYEIDIRDSGSVDLCFEKSRPDVVIHLAARAGVRPSLSDPKLYTDVNVNGTICILDAMRKHEVGRLVFASSSSVYGNNKKVPFSEADQLDSLISPYAITKFSGELMCKVYAELYGINTVALRFFTVYGPRQRPDLAISKFVRCVHTEKLLDFYGDGSSCRDYTFIADIVSGVLAAASFTSRGFRVFNLGGENPVSLKELVSIVENVVGKKAILNQLPMQAGDVDRTWAVIDAARSELGYSPTVSITQGIAAYYNWFLGNLSNP